MTSVTVQTVEPLELSALPTRIAEMAAALVASGVTVTDVYSELGAPIYHGFVTVDTDELQVMLRLLARRKGPVADLAAGSGRFTLPLAARGHHVTAIDLSPAMLALLHEQLDQATSQVRARVDVVQADLNDVELPRDLDAVVMGAGSISLFSRVERQRLFARIAGSLADEGIALVSTYVVTDESLMSDSESCHVFVVPHQHLVVTCMDHVDARTNRRTVALLPHLRPGQQDVLLLSTLHVVDRDELVSDAAAAGLQLRAEHAVAPMQDGRGAVLLELALSGDGR